MRETTLARPKLATNVVLETHRCKVCGLATDTSRAVAARYSYMTLSGNMSTGLKEDIYLCAGHWHEFAADIAVGRIMLDEPGNWLVNGTRGVVRCNV